MHISKAQKFVLFVFIIVVIGMMLFPPFHMVISGRSVNFGYSFLFSPPNKGLASVNIIVLLAQWLMAILVTAASFALAGSNKKKANNENKGNGDFTFYQKPKSFLKDIKTNSSMKNALLVILQLLNALIGVIFLVVAVGFIPVITWIVSPPDITLEMTTRLIIKAVIMFIIGMAFWGMRKFIKRLHKHWNETA